MGLLASMTMKVDGFFVSSASPVKGVISLCTWIDRSMRNPNLKAPPLFRQ